MLAARKQTELQGRKKQKNETCFFLTAYSLVVTVVPTVTQPGNACLVSLNPLQAIYVYQKAAILSMMSEEELKKTGEDIVGLFRSVSLIMS